MKLRSLTLSNVRKFAGQTATISNIGDGVTVVSEANEFGKSTFFDALHALFFLKYGAATREVKALQPHAGGPVRISAVIETPEGRFTVEKSYLAQKRASIRNETGTVIALDDEAEAWIARLMGNGLEGPAGLLWVRQGITALEPAGTTGADKTEKSRLLDARRTLLSSVAGEIDMVTGGRRMDRVIEAATQALARLATATGQPKANGPWKEAENEAQTYAARHDELERACRELSDALGQRRDVATRLKAMDVTQAQQTLTNAVDLAQAAYDTARTHADKLAQADAQYKLRVLELDGAQAKLDGLITADEALKKAQTAQLAASETYSQTVNRVTSAETDTKSAEEALAAASGVLKQATAAKEAAQQGALRATAQETLDRLQAVLEQVEQKRTKLEDATAKLSTLPVTQAALSQIETAQAALSAAQTEAAATGVQMEITYEGQERITSDGVSLAEGAHSISRKRSLEVPGVGRLTLDPGSAGADDARITKCQTILTNALSAVGVNDLESAQKGATLRREVESEIALLRNVVETLAPQGVERVRADVAQALARLGEMAQVSVQTDDDPKTLNANLDAARQAEQDARTSYEASRETRDIARTAATRAQGQRDAVDADLARAMAAYGSFEDFDDRKIDAARAHSLAQVAVEDAQTSVRVLRNDAPDLTTAQADLNRAKSAAQNAQSERADLQARSADLSATIRARAEDGVEEKRDEALGLMQRAQDRAARFAHEAASLSLLVDSLRDKRGAAQEAYFGPIQQELAPLLALLHADAALSFDPASLLPQGIVRGGTDEAMEMLSGGTQEQIAILTRLAFARLFARQGKPMPVILDDALVYSDDSRIVAMFTALHRVAHDQQVIVFSCRQMAFAELGGTRPRVEITKDI